MKHRGRDRICVAVSGIHSGENAQPGPGIIRCLRELYHNKIHIVGLAYDAMDSSLYMDGILDEAFLLPYPSVNPDVFLARLLEVHQLCNIDVLIPCLDVELPVLSHLALELSQAGIACALPSRQSLGRVRKSQLALLARDLGLTVPETLEVSDQDGLFRAAERLGYPMVVKGPFYEAEIVHSPKEAMTAFTRLVATWGLPLLAQRFVQGEEYNVALLGDGCGEVLGKVAMRKTILTRLGKAWGAMTIDDESVIDVAERVVRGLKWHGGCEVELLKDRAGTIHLIEINPRFPAWIYLSAAAGCNLPGGLIEMALGQVPALPASYVAGVFYVRHAVEAIGVVSEMEHLISQGRSAPRLSLVRKPPGAADTAGPDHSSITLPV